MKRSTVLLFTCLALAGGTWLAHVISAQTTEAKGENKFTITQSRLDKYVAIEVAKAVEADREKSGRDQDKPVTDEQVLNPQNWHKAIFNKAEYVIYTGPGQVMFHHWQSGSATPNSSASRPTGG